MDERDLKILALREEGYTFTEIAKMIANKQTGKVGITANNVRALYQKILQKKPQYDRKILKEAKVTYAQSILAILQDDTKYITTKQYSR